MRRIAFSPLCLGIAMSLALNLAPVAQAQEPEPDEVPEVVAVVGAPFSAVAVQESVRVTQDGNRFVRKVTTWHYRDGQGRTRLEREIPTPGFSANTSDGPPRMVTINNKVTGEFDSMFPSGKVATVMQRPGTKVVDAPAAAPEIFTWFSGHRFGAQDSGWAAAVLLGEKSINGLHVVGTQRVCTLAAGRVGNSKPVTITVQQWSSPDLGIIVDKTSTASTGGEVHYQLTQILQAEPDAALFAVPADYRKVVVKPGSGNVISAESPASNAATASAR